MSGVVIDVITVHIIHPIAHAKLAAIGAIRRQSSGNVHLF
jgi:hypothetical protein